MKYAGSCHCGDIAFEVEGKLSEVLSCNCSICSKRGSLLWFVPRTAFHLLTPDSNAATYTFNTHKIKHRFCPRCGCAPYAEDVDGEDVDGEGHAMAAINTRCLDGVELGGLKINHYDGRSA